MKDYDSKMDETETYVDPSKIVGFKNPFNEIVTTEQRPRATHRPYSSARRPSLFFPKPPTGTEPSFPPAESRPFKHAHIFRRPRPLQYWKPKDVNDEYQAHAHKNSIPETLTTRLNDPDEEESRDNLFKQLGRLDLFVDLVWVGIIAKISHSFSEKAFTHHDGLEIWAAFLEFLLTFVPIWRVWDHLRAFGSNFYNDGVLQRLFTLWILLVAVVFGINTEYAFVAHEEANSLTLLIGTYLVARASFIIAQASQCFFMPFLWRQFTVVLGGLLCTSALWIASIWVPYPTKFALLALANLIEHPLDIYIYSPMGKRLITHGWTKVANVEHYIERHEGFFILIVGEGVSRIVWDSPSGLGINDTTLTMLNALIIYYIIHWLYFDGDRAKDYVHALRCSFGKAVLWQGCHIIFFGALLIYASSNFYLVKHHKDRPNSPTDGAQAVRIQKAFWTSSISVAISLVSMTFIALLNKGLDGPKTLVVNSRYVRLAPRFLAVLILLCLPLFPDIDGGGYFGGTVVVFAVLFLWEWYAGLEREWEWVQEKFY